VTLVQYKCCDMSSVTEFLFFQFTTRESNYFVFKFPSVSLQSHTHTVLLLVFDFWGVSSEVVKCQKTGGVKCQKLT
jgi:hypothetical protein